VYPNMVLWDKQIELLKSVAMNQETWIKSGQSVSKTFTLALLPLWWLSCFSPALCLTTAPTWPQVENQLWGNLRLHYNNAEFNLGGKMLLTEWRKEGDNYAIGISTDKPEKFQGYHNPNILVIVDEGPGLRENIWPAIDAVLTSRNSRLVVAGNPLSKVGKFWNACSKPKEGRHLIHITCQEAAEASEKLSISGMVTKAWIDDKKIEWGEKNPLYISRVLGDFPDETEDTLFPLGWLEQCIGIVSTEANHVSIGVDVARSEVGDETVITVLDKVTGEVRKMIATRTKDLGVIENQLLGLNQVFIIDEIRPDDIGVGGELGGRLEKTILKNKIVRVNVAEKASDNERFANKRAEYYWNLRQMFRDSKIVIPIEYKDKLFAQLSPQKIDYSKGYIQIESKDKMKERGLPSPDWADSLMLATSWDVSIDRVSQKPGAPEPFHIDNLNRPLMPERRQEEKDWRYL